MTINNKKTIINVKFKVQIKITNKIEFIIIKI